jgi:hypothetical protein
MSVTSRLSENWRHERTGAPDVDAGSDIHIFQFTRSAAYDNFFAAFLIVPFVFHLYAVGHSALQSEVCDVLYSIASLREQTVLVSRRET